MRAQGSYGGGKPFHPPLLTARHVLDKLCDGCQAGDGGAQQCTAPVAQGQAKAGDQRADSCVCSAYEDVANGEKVGQIDGNRACNGDLVGAISHGPNEF